MACMLRGAMDPRIPPTFDPESPAPPGAGLFGLPFGREESAIALIPAPFDATCCYGIGSAEGPAAIREASKQMDLEDPQFGAVYKAGIFMEEEPAEIRDLSRRVRPLVEAALARGGAKREQTGGMLSRSVSMRAPSMLMRQRRKSMPHDNEVIREVDAAGEQVRMFVRDAVARALSEGKTPGVVGGEHAVALGAIEACSQRLGEDQDSGEGLGVLQIDAHMDLRRAYAGFQYSHASVMRNALDLAPKVSRIVQIGVRDYSAGEMETARASNGRVVVHRDLDWRRRLDAGETFQSLCAEAIEALPPTVYVTFDIDGLEPALCPNTGTPVPGGLTFNEAGFLLEALRDSGRRVIGFDLCETAPGGDDDDWDANVGARVLYKLCALGSG